MSVVVRWVAEPFTVGADTLPPVLAESDAYRQLRKEIERYAADEITGRSFLISGHRGAGKTSMVVQAVWEVSREPTLLTPLLVRIQGPDLLPDAQLLRPNAVGAGAVSVDPDEAEAAAGSGDDGDGASTPQPDGSGRPPGDSQAMAERALRQITQATYRALSETVANAFAETVAAVAHDHLPEDERNELAARFRLALDEAPPPAELRELYRLAGVLRDGVLPRSRRGLEQGMLELTALSSAAAAFRVVAGTVESRQTVSRDEERQSSRSIAFDPSTKDLIAQVSTLLLGGAVGAGALAGGEGAATAGLAAVATVLGAGLVLKVSSARTRKHAAHEEYTFLRDHTPSTLERELPVLFGRLRVAGLAPIFVVDELDKVAGLREQMNTVIGHLKQFVSERAFFCFLTDRDYFEHLRDVSLRQAYPHEHTFFHSRILVLFRPGDLDRYLDEILGIVGSEPDDEIHKELLAFELRHRSKMHAVDLRRELSRVSDENGYVRPVSRSGPTQPVSGAAPLGFSLGMRLTVTVQLAVELLLDTEPLRSRLDQDPQFGQPAYDALYYLSRTWEEGGDSASADGGVLDLSWEAFHAYLFDRMNPNPSSHQARATADDGGDGSSADPGPREERLPLSTRDEDLLRHQALAVAAFMADPGTLAAELDRRAQQSGALSYTEASHARDAIPTDTPLLVPLADDRFAFRFDPYGRKLETPVSREVAGRSPGPESRPIAGPRGAPPNRGELSANLAGVRGLDAFLFDATGMSLATLAHLYVLSAVPTWSQVEAAMQTLEAYVNGVSSVDHDEPPVELLDAAAALDDYLRGLEGRSWILAATVVYGSALGAVHQLSHHADPSSRQEVERRTRGVTVLATELRFDRLRTPQALERELRRYIATVQRPVSLPSDVPHSPLESDWQSQIASALPLGEAPPVTPDEIEVAWDAWRRRLERRVIGGTTEIHLTEVDLLCAVEGIHPLTHFSADVSAMTISQWGVMLREAMGMFGGPPRPWLAVAALVELGVGHLAELEPAPWTYDEVAESWIGRLRDTRRSALEPRPWAVIPRFEFEPPTPSGGAGRGMSSWRPSERYGALPILTATAGFVDVSWAHFGKLLPSDRPERQPACVLFEASPTDDLQALLEPFELGSLRPRVVVVHSDPTAAATKGGVATVAADTLDRAMEQALRLVGS
jgi:hypothetical protein